MFLLLFGLIQATSATPATETETLRPVFISGISVVQPDRGAVLPMMHVLVVGDRIAHVSADSLSVPEDALRIDGSGLFLAPGLVDLHVHASAGPGTRRIAAGLSRAGVTSIRIACFACGTRAIASDPSPVARGAFPGIRVLAVGTTPFTDSRTAGTYREDPASFHRSWEAAGITFFKAFSSLPRDIYAHLLEQGVRVEGHVPTSVSVTEALSLGQRTFDHIHDVLDECIEGGRSAREGRLAGRASEPLVIDTVQCGRLARAIRARDGAVIPTLVLLKYRAMPHVLDSIGRSIDGLPPSEREFWRAEGSATRTESKVPAEQEVLRSALEVVDILHQHGVRILAGSDTPFPFALPGESLHEELALLQLAGLTPAECLESATSAAAQHYGHGRLGRIEPGYMADLILLRRNPLADVENARDIVGVIQAGKYIDTPEQRPDV